MTQGRHAARGGKSRGPAADLGGMPIYEYVPDDDACDACRNGFEVLQGLNEPRLDACPECGAACHRVISSFAVPGRYSRTDPKNLEALGFSQYRKGSDGKYEKSFGRTGPDVLRRD